MLILTYLLNIIDYLFTLYWVRKYGIEIEGNPIGRWLYKKRLAAPIKIFGVGAALLTLHFAILHNPTLAWVTWVVLIPYALIVVYHIYLAYRIHSTTK